MENVPESSGLAFAKEESDLLRLKKLSVYLAVLAVVTACVIALVHDDEATPFQSLVKSSETPLLGAWQVEDVLGSGESASGRASQYLGFITQNGKNYLRTYYSGVARDDLVSIKEWKLDEVGGKKILSVFFYNESEEDPLERYEVTFQNDGSAVLAEVSVGAATEAVSSVPSKLLKRIRSAEEEFNAPLGLTSAENTLICNQLFVGESPDVTILLPLTCEVTIAVDEEPLQLTIRSDGSLEFIREGKMLSELGRSDDLISVASTYGGPILDPSAFEFSDFTFDGYKDLAVLSSKGAYQSSYKFFAYSPTSRTFAPRSLIELTEPFIDDEQKEVSTHYKGRGTGDIYTNETYKFLNGTFVVVHRSRQDMVDFDNPESDYVYTEEELRNGVLVETYREIKPMWLVVGGE